MTKPYVNGPFQQNHRLLRHYGQTLADVETIGRDGYPAVWHTDIKHRVREQAGHRCVRCGHPYRQGENGNGEWSPCDEGCTHSGPVRMRELYRGDGSWREFDLDPHGASPADALFDEGPGGERMQRYEIEARWRILTVHHLDGDKLNCRWWNLASLCQRCHLQIQGTVQMARVWPWEHSEWFKPYVAGYYAFVYLGEDLPRPAVEARLEELLALERSDA